VKQPKLPLPPLTEADYFSARADFIAAMKPDKRAAVEAKFKAYDEKCQKARDAQQKE
jgi:hypothetical protein